MQQPRGCSGAAARAHRKTCRSLGVFSPSRGTDERSRLCRGSLAALPRRACPEFCAV